MQDFNIKIQKFPLPEQFQRLLPVEKILIFIKKHEVILIATCPPEYETILLKFWISFKKRKIRETGLVKRPTLKTKQNYQSFTKLTFNKVSNK